jgi:hypothetical protein
MKKIEKNKTTFRHKLVRMREIYDNEKNEKKKIKKDMDKKK